MLNVQTLNNHVLLVKPDFHITTGRKKLVVEDLRLPNGSKLPPKCLVSLGSKKVIDPGEISVFTKLRDQAKAACEKVGIKFLGGFAVPLDKSDDLLEELEDIVDLFNGARSKFLNNYDSIVSRWCNENPDYEDVIRSAVPTHSYVRETISADYAVYQINPVEGRSEDRIERQVQGLSDELYKDIASIASKFLDESIYQRRSKQDKETGVKPNLRQDGVTQKALRTIRSMREKMDSLAFLDSSINAVIKQIDDVLRAMPAKGHIRSKAYTELYQLTLILSDVEKMKLLAEGLSTGSAPENPDAVLFDDLPLELTQNQQVIAVTDNLNQLDTEPLATSDGSESLSNEVISSQNIPADDLLGHLQSNVVLPDALAPISDDCEQVDMTDELAPIDLVAEQSSKLSPSTSTIGIGDDFF